MGGLVNQRCHFPPIFFVCFFYLGHLVDVVEAGQLDAQHVGRQPDGAPPPLAHLDEPGPAALAAH